MSVLILLDCFTLDTAENGVIGDTLANLYDYLGYKVTRVYYLIMPAIQMRNLAKSIYARYRQLTDSPDFPMPGRWIISVNI